MKSVIAILCLLTLTACGQRGVKNTTNTSTEEKTVQKSQSTATVESNNTHRRIEEGDRLCFQMIRGGEITFTVEKIKTIKLRDDSYNLILRVLIKNDTEEDLMVDDLSWKLTNANKVEIKEAGVYEPIFDDVMPTGFFMTIVDAGFGTVEQVGYKVPKGKYYLYALGKNCGEIVVE